MLHGHRSREEHLTESPCEARETRMAWAKRRGLHVERGSVTKCNSDSQEHKYSGRWSTCEADTSSASFMEHEKENTAVMYTVM
jgi:hypothetical protein